MRFRIMWDNQVLGEGAVPDDVLEVLPTGRVTLACSRPNTELRIPHRNIKAFSDAEGTPLAVPATRFAVELIPDYMDRPGYTD